MDPTPGERTILLVEDNDDDAELARLALEEGHFRNPVVRLRDGSEVLDYLFRKGRYVTRATSSDPAVILLDLKLPKLDGHEVLKRVRADALTRRYPVVMLTNSKEERDLVRSYEFGVNSYIQKPVDFAVFRETMRQLVTYWIAFNEFPPSQCVAR